MPVIDSHVHVLSQYPPMDPFGDLGRVDRLLYLMDETGVDQAVMAPVVSPTSPDNNKECARWARQHPDRLINLVAVPLHAADAAARVARIPEQYAAVGVSYYPPAGELSWMLSEPAGAVWTAMEAAGLVCSIQLTPPGYATLIELARRYPRLDFICNHLGLPGSYFGPEETAYGGLAAAREHANVFVKASGFYAAAATPWDVHCPRALGYLSSLIHAVGAERVLWGSDWPPVSRHLTYHQSLELVRSVAPLDAPVREALLGGNAARVFGR